MYSYVSSDSVIDFTTDSKYWIHRLISDAKEHPDEITILSTPSETVSSIRVLIPYKYLDIRDEQIQLSGGNQEWKKS